ncbi:hypothetical protein ACP2W0_17575 [Pseudobacillus badius]|uniref:hypothetical protein n=1 Tax=Bacillus badius TaxID=1455 RepID=UPI003CE8F79B
MDLKQIKTYEQLDHFLFEHEVELTCKKKGIRVTGIDPGKGGQLTFTLSNGSKIECLAAEMKEYLKAIPLIKG